MSETGICPVCNQSICVCTTGTLSGIADVKVEVVTLEDQINELRRQIESNERIKLSTLIKAWEQVHLRDTGDLGFCDFEQALVDAGVEVVNDCSEDQPKKIYRNECKP